MESMPSSRKINSMPRIAARFFPTIILLWLSLIGCQNVSHQSATTQISWNPPAGFNASVTVPYLASDELQGRGVGTQGLDKAADFMAEHFRAAGLKPLPGMSGYFQPFDYVVSSKISPETSLTLGDQILKLDQDFRPLGFSGEGTFHGPIVFAGYGITSKKHKYDDYANIDARGKVVLIKRFEPTDANGKSLFAPPGIDWSDQAAIPAKIANAARHGAVAVLLFTPEGLAKNDSLLRFSSSDTSTGNTLPVFHIHAAIAAQLKDGSQAAGLVRIEKTIAHLRNVVACLPGVGSSANEFVIVGAHYDHLGIGRGATILAKSGAIFHGADDNASGTAALLELAWHAGANPPRPRTIVFCAFTAEEEGLIGSRYFVEHPPLELNHVVAMLNMDMVGRVQDQTLYIGGTATAKDFALLADHADLGESLKLKPLPVGLGGRGGLGPSDHMSFAVKHIPILMLFSGMHRDYHRVTDTSDKINYAGIHEVASLADHLLDGLAAIPPEEYDASADLPGMTNGLFPSATDHLPSPMMGIAINPRIDIESGVAIESVIPGSAAERGGLLSGDVILRFAGKLLTGPADLAQNLALARPGDHVMLTIQRGKEIKMLQVILEERRG
jgi:hypothetical protein